MVRLQQENEALKVRLEGITTIKRKKVAQRFVDIKQVRRAQAAVGRVEDTVDEESGSERSEPAQDCIVVDLTGGDGSD